MAESVGANKTYTFNKATGIKDVFKSIPKSQTDYRTEKDIISLPSIFQRGGQKITMESSKDDTVLSAHSTKAFDTTKKKSTSKSDLFRFF